MQRKKIQILMGVMVIVALLVTACAKATSTTTSVTTTAATTAATTTATISTPSAATTSVATTTSATTGTTATGPLTHEGVSYTPYTGKFDRTFTFYGVCPLSGSGAGSGINAQRSYQWAIEDLNAQGGIVVDGVRYKIQSQWLDHAQNVQKANDAATILINQYNAKFAYEQTTAEVMATEDAYARANVFMLVEVIPQPKTIGTNWPLQFSICITPGTFAATVYYPLFIKDFGVKNIALVDPDSDNGRVFAGIAQTTTKQLGLPINFVSDLYYTPNSQDFSPLVNKVLALNPDFIDMPAAADGDAGLICKQARDAGYKGLMGTTIFTTNALPIWNIAGAASTGFFDPGYATDPTPQYAYFRTTWFNQFNSPIIPNCLSNYESCINMFRAIEKVGFDPYKVASVLQDQVWNSAFGLNTQYAGNEPGSIYGLKRFLKINEPMIRFTTNGNIQAWENGSW